VTTTCLSSSRPAVCTSKPRFTSPPRIDFDRTFNTTLAPCIATKHRSQTTADLSFVDGLSFPFAFPSRGGSYRRLRGFFGIWDATDVASRDLDLIILVMDLGTCQESEVNDGSSRPSQGYAGKKERGTAFLPRTSPNLMSFVVFVYARRLGVLNHACIFFDPAPRCGFLMLASVHVL
jgi:hypothetical protein